MSGRFLLDTNAVIALLKGNQLVLGHLKKANWFGISIITELEFLSFPNLSDNDKRLFQEFKSRVTVLGLIPSDTDMINSILEIRQTFKLKLPDAIIAGHALLQKATLLSNDS